MKPTIGTTPAGRPLNALMRAMSRLVRPRFTAQINGSQSTTMLAQAGRKLQPIADVLAQAGREPTASD